MVQTLALRMVAILLLLAVVLRVPAWGAEEPPPGEPPAPFNATVPRPTDDEAVERLLDQIVSLDFSDKVLSGLVEILAAHKIDALLDNKALEEAGIDSGTPLPSLKVSNISLRSALNLLLSAFNLEHVVQDGKLLITTTDVASNMLAVKIYRVDDLVRRTNPAGRQNDDDDSLIELIESTIDPQTWDEVGGPGSTGPFQGTLIVSQTERTHAGVARLLTALRESRAKQEAGPAPDPIAAISAAESAAAKKFAEKSNTAADFRFVEVTLTEAVAAIADRFGVPILLDPKALEEAGIDSDTPVTADLRQVTLPVALSMLTQPMDLTYVIKDEVVLITTTDVASNLLSVVVYPVADLVQQGPPMVGAAHQDFDTLVNRITSSIKPESWDEVGGPGSIEPLHIASSLTVSQTQAVHDQINRLLIGLRKLRKPLPEAPAAAQRTSTPQGRAYARGDDEFITRIYLLAPKVDATELVSSLRDVEPSSWSQAGARIHTSGRKLIVRTTRVVQRQVQKHLARSSAVQQGMGMMGGGMGGGMGGMGGGMGGGMF